MGFGAIAAAAAPAVISGIAGLAGGQAQNAVNRKEAERNRRFQERMRNTQWQAAVADMEAAGLNPALAYSQGGNSSPGGSMASQEDAIGKGVSSAMQAMQMKKSLQLLDEQISKTRAEAASANIQQLWAAERARYFGIGTTNEARIAGRMHRVDPTAWEMFQAELNSAKAMASQQLGSARLLGIEADFEEQMKGWGPGLRLLRSFLKR